MLVTAALPKALVRSVDEPLVLVLLFARSSSRKPMSRDPTIRVEVCGAFGLKRGA